MVIRLVSWAWISRFDLHSQAGSRPTSQQRAQGSWPPLGRALLARCTADHLPKGLGSPRLRSSWFLHTHIFPTPLPTIDQLKGQKVHWAVVMCGSLYFRETKMQAKEGKTNLLWFSLCVLYCWYLKTIVVVWLIYVLHNKRTGDAKRFWNSYSTSSSLTKHPLNVHLLHGETKA